MASRTGNPRWVKGGASPNPGGRPKGLGETIRARLGDGEKLITWMLKIAQTAAKDADRIQAIKWLSDHAYGKPVETLEFLGGGFEIAARLKAARERVAKSLAPSEPGPKAAVPPPEAAPSPAVTVPLPAPTAPPPYFNRQGVWAEDEGRPAKSNWDPYDGGKA